MTGSDLWGDRADASGVLTDFLSSSSVKSDVPEHRLLFVSCPIDPLHTERSGEVTRGVCTGVSVSELLSSPSSPCSSSPASWLWLDIRRRLGSSIKPKTSAMREGPRSTVKEVRESERVRVSLPLSGAEPFCAFPSWNCLSMRERRGRVTNPDCRPANKDKKMWINYITKSNESFFWSANKNKYRLNLSWSWNDHMLLKLLISAYNYYKLLYNTSPLQLLPAVPYTDQCHICSLLWSVCWSSAAGPASSFPCMHMWGEDRSSLLFTLFELLQKQLSLQSEYHDQKKNNACMLKIIIISFNSCVSWRLCSAV